MYCVKNFRTKKELIAAVKSGEVVQVFQPGPFPAVRDGRGAVEGPHYPEPHRWYASVEVRNGTIVTVK
jgi:hypothetical protein